MKDCYMFIGGNNLITLKEFTTEDSLFTRVLNSAIHYFNIKLQEYKWRMPNFYHSFVKLISVRKINGKLKSTKCTSCDFAWIPIFSV